MPRTLLFSSILSLAGCACGSPPTELGPADAAVHDAAVHDAAVHDAAAHDAAAHDAGELDAALPADAGPVTVGAASWLATVEMEARPVLYVQRVDGSERRQIHFSHLRSTIPGDVDDPLVEVDDARIVAIPALSFRPDGRVLAAVVSIGYDESQIVTIDLENGAQRVVSYARQYVMGTPDWSSDGARLGYAMSVTARPVVDELFVTELSDLTITQRTHTGGMTNLGAGQNMHIRFATDDASLMFTRTMVDPTMPFGRLTELDVVDATGLVIPLDTDLHASVADVRADASASVDVHVLGADADGVEDHTLVLRTRATGATRPLLEHVQVVTVDLDTPEAHAIAWLDNYTAASGHDYSLAVVRLSDGVVARVPLPRAVGQVVRPCLFLTP